MMDNILHLHISSSLTKQQLFLSHLHLNSQKSKTEEAVLEAPKEPPALFLPPENQLWVFNLLPKLPTVLFLPSSHLVGPKL